MNLVIFGGVGEFGEKLVKLVKSFSEVGEKLVGNLNSPTSKLRTPEVLAAKNGPLTSVLPGDFLKIHQVKHLYWWSIFGCKRSTNVPRNSPIRF